MSQSYNWKMNVVSLHPVPGVFSFTPFLEEESILVNKSSYAKDNGIHILSKNFPLTS